MNNIKFGIREVCNCLFEKQSGIGPEKFIIDTAKMTTFEGTSTTVYATGGNGNSRLMAWEGEKTLTFTLEDALISLEAFEALTGTNNESTITGVHKYTIKSTSFAGIYKITAKTLFRDENGIDHVATITIPKAKLQTNLNLAMAPSGDPSTFTYTFDALNSNMGLLTLEVNTNTEDSADDLVFNKSTFIKIDDTTFEIDTEDVSHSTKLTLAVAENANIENNKYTITLSADNDTFLSNPITKTLSNGEVLTNLLDIVLKPGDSHVLKLGSSSTWFII